MTNLEIKEKVAELNNQIMQILNPNVFTLNNLVLNIQKEINQLQEICAHEFDEGYCKYCNKEEKGE